MKLTNNLAIKIVQGQSELAMLWYQDKRLFPQLCSGFVIRPSFVVNNDNHKKVTNVICIYNIKLLMAISDSAVSYGTAQFKLDFCMRVL